MSTVQINPGDNVQSKINASASGDTIVFAAGNYANFLALSNRTYKGSGASFSGGEFSVEAQNQSNMTFDGLTMSGQNGIHLSGSSNVKVVNCTFQNLSARGIDYFGGMKDVLIQNNTFKNIRGDGCILGWNGVRFQILNNSFDSVHEGVHSFWGGDRGGPDNCVIKGNVFTNVQHFALEQQGNPNGLDICFNWADDWVPQDSQIGFSIATGGDHGGIDPNNPNSDSSHGVKIHDNFIGQNNLSNGKTNSGNFGAIEVMGWDTSVYNNLIGIGSTPFGWNCIAFYTFTSSNWSCFNNIGVGVNKVLDSDSPANKMVAPANSTNNKMLAANAMTRPTAADVVAGKCSWQTGGSGVPTPTPTPAPTPSNITGIAVSSTEIDIVLPGTPGTLTRHTTHGTDAPVVIAAVVAGTKLFQDKGRNPSWEYNYSFNGGSEITVQCLATDPTPTPTPVPAKTLVSITLTYSDGTSDLLVMK